MDRAAIHDLLRGTHDIARAAELLAASGDITYWQSSESQPRTKGEFEGTGDALRNADHLNCFEFVHLCNLLSCCQDHPGNLATDNFENHLLDLTAGLNEWNGRSPIPRGSVVVGTALPPWGPGKNGIFHVGIAVDDDTVVSNRSGENVKREPIAGVFGGIVGAAAYRVFYGPYPHCRCRETDADHATHAHGYPLPTTGPRHALPDMSTKLGWLHGLGARDLALGVTLVFGTALFAFSWVGSLVNPGPTPLPTLSRVPASPAPSASAVVALPPGQCSGPVKRLVEGFYPDVVQGAGGTPPAFDTGGKRYCLIHLATYHWNDGKGDPPVGQTLSVRDASGTLIGSWPVVGTPGTGGTLSGWEADVPLTPPVVIDGTYTVVDSKAATWSWSKASGGKGFVRVYVIDYVTQ